MNNLLEIALSFTNFTTIELVSYNFSDNFALMIQVYSLAKIYVFDLYGEFSSFSGNYSSTYHSPNGYQTLSQPPQNGYGTNLIIKTYSWTHEPTKPFPWWIFGIFVGILLILAALSTCEKRREGKRHANNVKELIDSDFLSFSESVVGNVSGISECPLIKE